MEFDTCYYLKLEILDKNNNLDITKLKALYYESGDARVEKCAVKKESLQETAYYIHQCLNKGFRNT